MRRQTGILIKANHSLERMGICPENALHNTKLLLKQYRQICWSFEDRLSDLGQETAGFGSLDFFVGLFEGNPNERMTSKFSTAYDSRILIHYIEKSMLKLREYPKHGEIYYFILNKLYFLERGLTEQEMLENIHMERSVYYDRKKEAISLFGSILWGFIIPVNRNPDFIPTKSRQSPD